MGYIRLQKQRSLSPFSSPVLKLTTPFSPWSRRLASLGSFLPPCTSHPHESTVSQLTECVRTRSPSASRKGSGIWWFYTEGSPDRPCRPFPIDSPGRLLQPQTQPLPSSPKTRRQAGSYQQALGWSGPFVNEHRPGTSTAAQTFRQRVFRSCCRVRS